ncbi:MAG TPA: hypothetical protein VFT62_03300, partial [Mycobacteriales bacterium]|nr:hypothetical protein [Mycobacteriales bacterium]
MMQLDHEEPELRLALDEIVIDVRPRVGLAADVVRLGRRTRRRRRVAASLVAASVVGVGGYLSAGVLGDSGDGMMIVRPAVESPTATPSAQLSPTTAPAPQQHKSRTGSAPAAITA